MQENQSEVDDVVHDAMISLIDHLNIIDFDDEIKVKKSKLKVGFIQRKILRYNQQLALKNYKRQGK